MGGGNENRTGELYGSPYGGERVGPNPNMQIVLPEAARLLNPPPDKRSSEEVPFEEYIDNQMKARVINDFLKRLITPEMFNGPQFNPKNTPQKDFNPYS